MEQEGINHKAAAFIQGDSLDFYLLFLLVQDQVIFFKTQTLAMTLVRNEGMTR